MLQEMTLDGGKQAETTQAETRTGQTQAETQLLNDDLLSLGECSEFELFSLEDLDAFGKGNNLGFAATNNRTNSNTQTHKSNGGNLRTAVVHYHHHFHHHWPSLPTPTPTDMRKPTSAKAVSHNRKPRKTQPNWSKTCQVCGQTRKYWHSKGTWGIGNCKVMYCGICHKKKALFKMLLNQPTVKK